MKAPKLNPNDLVAIISPSKTVVDKKEQIERGARTIAATTGLRTVLSPNAFAQHHYSAGTAKQRLADFHWALENPEVKAIIFSCGGYSALDLVKDLDYDLIKRNTKVITGISDATTLLNAIYAKTGLVTFLGVEVLDFAEWSMPYAVASMKKSWFDGEVGRISPNPQWQNFDGLPTAYREWETIREGKVSGRILGGNYPSFSQLYPTEYLSSLDNAILVVEHYGRTKEAIHNSLVRLKLWGVLDKIGGLIMGYCLGSDNPKILGNDRKLADLVLEATDGYDFPVMQIGEIGHEVENIMLPIGAQATLDATNKIFEITEPVVS